MLKHIKLSVSVAAVTTKNLQKNKNPLIRWSLGVKHMQNKAHVSLQKKVEALSIITLYTNNLIKPYVNYDINWSSGMLSKLLFKFDTLESQKYTSTCSARKDWSLWKFIHAIWWEAQNHHIQKLTPWSIRIRRFFKYVSNLPTYTIIGYSFSAFITPKKKIKRWLKKKYTTHSWR